MQTSGYDADGRRHWDQAKAWAGSLNIDGMTGWRLPGGPMMNTPGTKSYNETASEMGNLFYNVLGGTAGSNITTTHNANYNLFQNVQSWVYWSGVESFSGSTSAWANDFRSGLEFRYGKSINLSAWAVRSGDVGASPVPVPGALVLMGPALLGLLGVKRSRRRA